ncbi:hypothetical protein N8009_01475 [Flavobacteriaceae bacterium]|nr:hypothetical protein [Flavobacteriaceae bacterium]
MKQKRLKNYLKLGILLFGISLILINCQTDELTFDANKQINAKTVSFEEAKAFFESKNGSSQFAKRTTSDALVLNPDWNSLEHSDLVYTDAQLTKANTDVNRIGDFSSKLLFVNIDDEIQSVILTTWVTDYDSIGNIINATIFFNDYDGNFIDAYKIENGLFTHRLVPSSNVQTAGVFMFLQDKEDWDDIWNCGYMGGELEAVDLGTINTVQDGGGSGGFTPLPGGTYGGYINGGVSSSGGRPNTSGPGGGGITSGGIDIGAATILMNPIGSTNTYDQNTQNHLNALNQFTGHNQIKGKINELQGKLNINQEFGYQFNSSGSNYSIIAGIQNNDGTGIAFPPAQSNTELEVHTHHYGLDPVFSIEDVFNAAKLYNTTGNTNATVMVITTPTKLYALRINDATLATNFFNHYNVEANFDLLVDDYNKAVIGFAQQTCGGTCTDVQFEIYLNYYLNQLLELLDSGLMLFAGYENADGTITWNPFN